MNTRLKSTREDQHVENYVHRLRLYHKTTWGFIFDGNTFQKQTHSQTLIISNK